MKTLKPSSLRWACTVSKATQLLQGKAGAFWNSLGALLLYSYDRRLLNGVETTNGLQEDFFVELKSDILWRNEIEPRTIRLHLAIVDKPAVTINSDI